MIAGLEPHEYCQWRSGIVGTRLLNQDKAVLEMAPLHSLRYAYIEVF
jgi:hypothetical protein